MDVRMSLLKKEEYYMIKVILKSLLRSLVIICCSSIVDADTKIEDYSVHSFGKTVDGGEVIINGQSNRLYIVYENPQDALEEFVKENNDFVLELAEFADLDLISINNVKEYNLALC